MNEHSRWFWRMVPEVRRDIQLNLGHYDVDGLYRAGATPAERLGIMIASMRQTTGRIAGRIIRDRKKPI